MCASFAGVARGTRTKGSKHVREFLWSLARLEPTARRELWFACTGTGVSTGGRAHSAPFFLMVRTKESTLCKFYFR